VLPSASHEATTSHRQPWDEAANGWNRHAALTRTWLKEATAAMLDAACIASGSRVLDIAAGSGDQTLDIARRIGAHGYVLATDVSAAILTLARQNFHAAGLHYVHTRLADAQALGLAGADFDAAICRLGLMFCVDPLEALIQARMALKPGGRFSALVFSTAEKNPCLGITIDTACKHAGITKKSTMKPGTLLSLGEPGLLDQLLRAAGFIDINVHPLSAPFRLSSSAQYVDFLRYSASPIMEMLALLSTEAQINAWNDIEKQLNVFNTASGWEGPNELLLCSAVALSAIKK
jgi:SAM-dependent methyltransferase